MLKVDVLQQNAVSRVGTGPPMLLIHGYGCDQGMWNRLAPLFEKDHQVIRYDLTGMGDADESAYDSARHGNLQGHADDLIHILDELDVGPVHAVAHSVSAIIAGLAAAARPELFASISMLGPNPRYIDDPPYEGGFSAEAIDGLLDAVSSNYQGWAGQLAALVAGKDEGSEAELRDRFCRNNPAIAQHFAEVTFKADNRADLARIQTPTLLVQVSEDPISSPAVGRYVQTQIEGSKLVEIDGTGHAPHMTHPAETEKAIRDFISALPT